jgi:NADH-quinone oxidoreductase subunit M
MSGLLWLILLPALVAAATPLVPARLVRHAALLGTLAPVALFLYIAGTQYDWSRGNADQLHWSWDWFPGLGVSVSLAADTVSMLLVGLTVLLGPICVLSSYTAVTERVKTYYGWLVALQAAMTGVFIARDLVLFYIFFEFTLVPLYILISLYGSTNRKAAATKFFLYTFTGSIITLAGLVYVAWYAAAVVDKGAGGWTFAFDTLRAAAQAMPLATQAWVFGALMLGFAIKVPLFPLHTWLPLAHTEAPTAGSVVLAGVLLKLGTYGMYRFALEFTPMAAVHYAPAVATLAVVGILYGGLVCWVQSDAKKLVAYSSVSHLGFCILGLFAFSAIGLTGSVLYMINHGLSTGALFLMIGMIYERYHTRSMKELGGLAGRMPVWATFMVFFVLASVGLPGLNGFVSEFLCLLGAFQAGDAWSTGGFNVEGVAGVRGELGPVFAAIAGLGMIITAIYLLYMVGRVVWGTPVEPRGHDHHHGDGHGHGDGRAGGPPGGAHALAGRPLPRDLSPREIAVLAPLAALCLLLGVYPTPILRSLEAPTRSLAATMDAARHRLAAEHALPGPTAGHAAAVAGGPEAGR